MIIKTHRPKQFQLFWIDSIVFGNLETGKELKWLVKHQEMKKSKKPLIARNTEESEEEFFIYKG